MHRHVQPVARLVVAGIIAAASLAPLLARTAEAAVRGTDGAPAKCSAPLLATGTALVSGLPYDPSPQPALAALGAPACAGADAPAFGPTGKVYIADFYTGTIYVLGRVTGRDRLIRLPQAHFGRDNLFALTFGKDGELYASLWGARALRPEVVELDGATGAEVRLVADRADGLADCPGRPAVGPGNGDLYVPDECPRAPSGASASRRSAVVTVVSQPSSAHPVVSSLRVPGSLPGALASVPRQASPGYGYQATHRGRCTFLAYGPVVEEFCHSSTDLSAIATLPPQPSSAFGLWPTDVISAASTVGVAVFVSLAAGTFEGMWKKRSALAPGLWRRRWCRRRRTSRRRVVMALGAMAAAVLVSLIGPAFGPNLVTVLGIVAVAGAFALGWVVFSGPARAGGLQVALYALGRLGLGVAAWLIWAALYHLSDGPGSFVGAVLADDFLAAFFILALAGTVVSLVPVPSLPGYALKTWHPAAWLGTFVVASFALVQLVLRP